MKNSGYSSSEILSMQEDAVKRVKEMQRRANSHLPQPHAAARVAGRQTSDQPPRDSERPAEPPRTAALRYPADNEKSAPGRFEIGGLLSQFSVSEDKAVVLAIILILMSQGADKSLILALLYLIM